MLLWPTITALGFVALIAVVIALGTRSTARYEAERERAGELADRAVATVHGSPRSGRWPVGGGRPSGPDGRTEARPPESSARSER